MNVRKVYEMAVDAYGDVRTLVRGLPYQCPDDWEDVLDSLDEDSNLYLIKEPDNPKDELAIAAYLDDRRVGYVAASDNGKIWLYMTEEKMPCTFIERFEASFKISFDNPRPLFEGMPFKEIYKDKFGVTEQLFPAFDIPFLSNPKDKRFEWFDDRVYIADLERAIPDFRRKLATRMIILTGRKNSKGEYNYYLPYANNPIADVEDDIIKGIIDRYGFVIALPDVPTMTHQGTIFMDLHVTNMKNTDYKDFNLAHQSELVFSLTKDYDAYDQKVTDDQSVADGDAFFKQALEEEMDYKEETVYSDADNDLGAEIVEVVNDYLSGESPTPYQVLVIPQGGTVLYKSLEGKEIAKSTNDEILKLAEENRGAMGYITDVDYDDHDGEVLVYRVTIRAYRSIPRVTIQQDPKASVTSMKIDTSLSTAVNDDEYYTISDSPEGGKHVSMDVIIPEDGDSDFDFCTYECRISDKKQIDIITKYMKRYEDFKEPRPFLMIGRPCLGLDNLDIFYSLDGEIIFNFIFDKKIKGWIREAGFVLGKVKSYKPDSLFTDQLSVTLSVSKRKSGETLFKQASEEAMDYIEIYTSSQSDHDVEIRIIDAVKKYMSGDSAMPYKVVIVPHCGIGTCTTLDGEDVAIIVDDEIIELAEKNKGVFGYITKVDYDDDGDAWFTIRVSRSIPRLTLEQETDKSDSTEAIPDSPAAEEQSPRPLSISEDVFAKFISENIGCDILNAPNSSWSYDTTDFLGNGRDMYETYIFKKRVPNNLKCSEIQANVVRGKSVNFCLDFKMNKREIYDFVYRYKKLFFPDYTFAKCKKEYASEQFSIYTEGITPSLDIRFPFMGDPCSMVFYTSFCNTAYVEKKKSQKKILTLEK